MSLDARARIVIEAVTRQAIADMAKTGQAIKGVGDQTKQQTGILQGAGQAWKSMLVGIGAATAALYTAKKAFDFAREGAEILELRDAFAGLATEAGQSSTAIVSAIRRGADGTIASMDAISVATKVMNLGIASTPEQFEKLANVAETLGDRLGKDTATSINDVSAALTSLMPRAIRSAGITADAEGVWTRYAESIGKTLPMLTDAEKRTALLDDANKRLGTGVASTADQFDRFEANLKDLKDTAAVASVSAIGPLVERLAAATSEGLEFGTALGDLDYLISKRLPYGFTLMADGTIKSKDELIRMNAELAANRDKFVLADSEMVRYANHLAMLNGSSVSTTVVTNYVTGGGGGGPGANMLAAYRQDPNALTSTQAATARRVASVSAGVSGYIGGRQHGGRLGAGMTLVGEAGPEMVINGVVIPTNTTRQLMKLGLIPGKTMLLGGGFETSQKGSFQKSPTLVSSSFSKEFLGTTSAAEAFGGGGGGGTQAAATAVAEQAAATVAAEIAPAITAAVVASQAAGQVASAQITQAAARTVAATAETNSLLREMIEILERQGDSGDVGRAVRDGIQQVQG